jgi:type II secretion system protein H
MRKSGQDSGPWRAEAFTLVEFILVMALLATLMALVAPSLSRSMRQRHLEQEATRLVALTEYGRNQAVSDGFPMVIWIDAEERRYGLQTKPGFMSRTRDEPDYELGDGIRFDLGRDVRSVGVMEAIEFSAGGTVDPRSLEAIWLIDSTESTLVVAQSTNGWGYEVLREEDYLEQRRGLVTGSARR